MKLTLIYQTVEDRNNDEEIMKKAPFLCALTDKNGVPKKGNKVPWLGEGYYFWDTNIQDAHWWGNTVYAQQGYIICRTEYDAHSEQLYDLLGDLMQLNQFIECAKLIKKKNGLKHINFTVVLEYLRKLPTFNYTAVRIMPCRNQFCKSEIEFSNNQYTVPYLQKVQICFFDKTLLTQPICIAEKVPAHQYIG